MVIGNTLKGISIEKTITADSELTRDEFTLQVPPAGAVPMWIVGAAVATIAIATACMHKHLGDGFPVFTSKHCA